MTICIILSSSKMNVKKIKEKLAKIPLQRDLVSGRVYKFSNNEREKINTLDLWIEAIEEEYLDFSTFQLLLKSEKLIPTFNSVKEYLESDLPSNPQAFEDLGRLVKHKANLGPRFVLALKKWFVSAVKAVYEEDFTPKYCLVLIGEEGIGKTPFLKSFLPKEMRSLLVSDPCAKEEGKALCCNLIAFIEEIQQWTDRTQNKNRYRGFMSLEEENGKPRIASFLGTARNGRFLEQHQTDRFVTFEISHIWNKKQYQERKKTNPRLTKRDLFAEDFDISQVWKRAMELYQEGFDVGYSEKELQEIRRAQLRSMKEGTLISLFSEFFEEADRRGSKGKLWTCREIRDFLKKKDPELEAKATSVGIALTKNGLTKLKSNGRQGYFLVQKNAQ